MSDVLMVRSDPELSEGELLRALVMASHRLTRAQSVSHLISQAGGALEALGFEVAFAVADDGRFGLRYLTPRLESLALGHAVLGVIEGLRPGSNGPIASPLRQEGLKKWAALVALEAGQGGERLMLCMADRLEAHHLSAVELFALHLGTVLVAVEIRKELEEKTAELKLVSQGAERLYRDLKKSYDDLGRAQKELVNHERLSALGELAAIMAHEVRNPLGVIFNSLTTLKRVLPVTGDAEMLINIVGEEAERLNRIVTDLLDFVRPFELQKKEVALDAIIASAIDSNAQTMVQRSVSLVTDVPAALPNVAADEALLKQALVHLLANAVQAMPKGGSASVRVRVEHRGNAPWLCIEVRDEGVGLNAMSAARIFQPFFTTKATGTGLGLAVVKRIVDAHEGEVSAVGHQPEPGTTFTIRLPVQGK